MIIFSPEVHSASWWGDSDYIHDIKVVDVDFLYEGYTKNEVVFIDTREQEEFYEGHLPGAINIRLVDLEDYDLSMVKKFKYVVPYCVKDFRGYEVARKLKSMGHKNVFMMNPPGLNGWKKRGKPLEY